jgi:hypothetical protein
VIDSPQGQEPNSIFQNGAVAVGVLSLLGGMMKWAKASVAKRTGAKVTMEEAAKAAVQQLISSRFIDTLVDARLQRLFEQGKEHEDNTNRRFEAMEGRVDSRFESLEDRMDVESRKMEEESRKRMADRGLILRAVQELRQDLGK